MIAQVIVDVAAKQTDRLFEYLVPHNLETDITIGSRIVVPFGKSRKVQGFVVNLVEETDYTGQLKELLLVVDEQAPLIPELVDLSAYLSQQNFSYRISILKAMLPRVMRANYRKILVPLVKNELTEDFFGTAEMVDLDANLDVEAITKVNKLLKQNFAKIEYLVENKAKPKEQIQIRRKMSVEDLNSAANNIRPNAQQQIVLMDFLLSPKAQEQNLQADLMKDLNLTSEVFVAAAKKGWITREKAEVYRNPIKEDPFDDRLTKPLDLNDEQATALAKINAQIESTSAHTFLLEGITGSGKTEVYLQAMAHALTKDKTALMLVPEISLTPQMVKQVHGRFGKDVAVLHSGLSEGEKYDEWRRIRRDEVKIVVGARSAIFAPIKNLGLIIIDEEHESSYKQSDNPKYHARDVAIWRANYQGATLLLGSATPSLESRARAQKNVYELLTLTKRANQKDLPEVKIIDLKKAEFSNQQFDLSDELVEQIASKIERKEQVILFLNRRGFASLMLCRDCGFVLKCPNCDISLTYHKDTNSMKCHYCGHEEAVPRICPNCQSNQIRFYGTGTQKVEEKLHEILPEARVLRMDVDTTRRKGSYERILEAFGNHSADILLGTQMIAKGLDFANVTLVGVINADTSLSFPDFRSAEKTFQLLTQVSGRAGRAQKSGNVLVQTFNPNHYAITLAQTQNYEDFYQHEMIVRHKGNYPPYFYTVLISVASKKEINASKKAFMIKRLLLNRLDQNNIILGPTPSAVSKINEYYYYQILVKYKREPKLNQILHEIQDDAQTQKKYGVNVEIDIEPERFI